jgi:folate-binding protein YgfZ
MTTHEYYNLLHLGILSVTGDDAASFLQGQMTCSVYDVTDSQSRISAFCDPKGRVISTFFLVKNQNGFLLILPQALLITVLNRLERYRLRAKVEIADVSEEMSLIGIRQKDTSIPFFDIHALRTHRESLIFIDLDVTKHRTLAIVPTDAINEHFPDCQIRPPQQWQLFDIESAIPWLSTETSEEFIPQWLDLHHFNAISYTKGCYTGQEVVARTHHLGKVVRSLAVLVCKTVVQIQPNCKIVNNLDDVAGNVLQFHHTDSKTMILAVIKVNKFSAHSHLDHSSKARLSIFMGLR